MIGYPTQYTNWTANVGKFVRGEGSETLPTPPPVRDGPAYEYTNMIYTRQYRDLKPRRSGTRQTRRSRPHAVRRMFPRLTTGAVPPIGTVAAQIMTGRVHDVIALRSGACAKWVRCDRGRIGRFSPIALNILFTFIIDNPRPWFSVVE